MGHISVRIRLDEISEFRLKKILLGLLVLFVAVVVTGCGDNSIDTRVDPAASASASVAESLASTVKFPVEVTGARVSAGEVIYSQNCASCHGPVNGPTVLDAAPVHGDAGHTWHHPDRLLFTWILDRPPLATLMPAFRGTLSDDEVMEVLAYIKSHWLPEIQDRQNEGSAQYEAQVIEFGVE
jgi:mono/diheme cytochrome c family protein